MKPAVYVRVSTVGQNEVGQRREITRWLKGNRVDNATWYVDKDSGDNLDRPEFQRLQQAIFEGRHDAVIVYKLDRLSRTVRDGLAVLCNWCEKGLRVVSTTQQIDFNGTIGKMIAAVLFGVAEMEQETDANGSGPVSKLRRKKASTRAGSRGPPRPNRSGHASSARRAFQWKKSPPH